MIKTILSLLIFSLFDFGFKGNADDLSINTQDKSKEILERQILYNGRIWQTQFFNTEGNQFFLLSDFSTSGVGVAGHNFDNVKIRYDLINDELHIQRNDGTIIMLNKEMVNYFSLFYYDKLYRFINFDITSYGILNGYYQILYDGKIKIYVKYTKELIPTTITNGLPRFSQIIKIYIFKDGKIHRINNRKELLNLFAEGEEQGMIKKYIRTNHIILSRNDPDSYSRVIEYYETNTK
jgi:hypothetical protein